MCQRCMEQRKEQIDGLGRAPPGALALRLRARRQDSQATTAPATESKGCHTDVLAEIASPAGDVR